MYQILHQKVYCFVCKNLIDSIMGLVLIISIMNTTVNSAQPCGITI